MDPTLLALIALVIGLAIGAGAGWFFGSRPVAELKARFEEREGEFKAAIAELGEAQIKLATLNANAANFDEQKRLLIEAQEALKKEFEAAGARVLESAQEAFLKRASERLTVSED